MKADPQTEGTMNDSQEILCKTLQVSNPNTDNTVDICTRLGGKHEFTRDAKFDDTSGNNSDVFLQELITDLNLVL